MRGSRFVGMHRSRVSTFLIDAPRDQAPQAAAFWSSALGAPTQSEPDEPQFTVLQDALPGFVTAVQAVDDEPRYELQAATLSASSRSTPIPPTSPNRPRPGPELCSGAVFGDA